VVSGIVVELPTYSAVDESSSFTQEASGFDDDEGSEQYEEENVDVEPAAPVIELVDHAAESGMDSSKDESSAVSIEKVPLHEEVGESENSMANLEESLEEDEKADDETEASTADISGTDEKLKEIQDQIMELETGASSPNVYEENAVPVEHHEDAQVSLEQSQVSQESQLSEPVSQSSEVVSQPSAESHLEEASPEEAKKIESDVEVDQQKINDAQNEINLLEQKIEEEKKAEEELPELNASQASEEVKKADEQLNQDSPLSTNSQVVTFASEEQVPLEGVLEAEEDL